MAVAGAATLLVLAGCGSNGSSPTGGAKAGGHAGSSARCTMANASMVNGALGTNVGEPTVQDNTPITVCTYHPVSGIGTVIVRMQTDSSASAFSAGKAALTTSGQSATDLAGLGDEAYTSTLGSGQYIVNTTVARRGSVEILVSSKATFDQEKALISQLFSQL